MLFGDCDGNSLTILKLQPENFWLTLLWIRCTTLTVDLEIFYRKLLATVLQKARPILAPSSPGVVFPEQWTTQLHCASWLVACLSTMMADWYHVTWNDKHILTKFLFIAGGRHEPGNVQRKLTLHRQGSIKNTRSKLLSLFIIIIDENRTSDVNKAVPSETEPKTKVLARKMHNDSYKILKGN